VIVFPEAKLERGAISRPELCSAFLAIVNRRDSDAKSSTSVPITDAIEPQI
jgi:hypothetical protein